MGALASWWLADAARTGLDVASCASTIRKHIINNNLINDRKATELTYNQAQTWFSSVKGEPSTRNLIRSYLSRIYNRAIMAGYLPITTFNPTRFIRAAKVVKPAHEDYRILNPEEVRNVIMAADPDFRTMVATAVFMGLRRKELLTIKLEDVEDGRIRIRRANTKTAASARRLPIPAALAPWISSAYAEAKDLGSHYLFCNPRTGRQFDPNTDLNRLVLAPALRSAGVVGRVHWHTLRHTTASLLVANGATLEDVHVYMGHSNIKTTVDIYMHVQDSHLVRVAKIMSDVIG